MGCFIAKKNQMLIQMFEFDSPPYTDIAVQHNLDSSLKQFRARTCERHTLSYHANPNWSRVQ